MDDILYDTSWNLFSLDNPTQTYRELAHADLQDLNAYATKLREYFSVQERPRYEAEEEKEKIGGLRDCQWNLLDQRKEPRNEQGKISRLSGIWIELVYDRATYKFVLLGQRFRSSSSTNSTNSGDELALLLSKSAPSSTLTKRFLGFLDQTFHVEFRPLKLTSALLTNTLHNYVTGIHETIISDPRRNVQKILQSTVGSLKLTITISVGAGNTNTTTTNGDGPTTNSNANGGIAPNLKNIEIDIPPQTLSQLLSASASQASLSNNGSGIKPTSFLKVLSEHIHNRTGLRLPLTLNHSYFTSSNSITTSTTNNNSSSTRSEPPLKLTKLSAAAYALSVEGKLKIARKAVDGAVEFGEEIESALRQANEEEEHEEALVERAILQQKLHQLNEQHWATAEEVQKKLDKINRIHKELRILGDQYSGLEVELKARCNAIRQNTKNEGNDALSRFEQDDAEYSVCNEIVRKSGVLMNKITAVTDKADAIWEREGVMNDIFIKLGQERNHIIQRLHEINSQDEYGGFP